MSEPKCKHFLIKVIKDAYDLIKSAKKWSKYYKSNNKLDKACKVVLMLSPNAKPKYLTLR